MEVLENFLRTAKGQPGFTSLHVSIYSVMFLLYMKNDSANPITVSRKQIMQLSKIKSIVTYHKCMRELIEAGVIDYTPSYNKYTKSLITIKGAE